MFWYTSDEHFGHENVIKYCHRPFYCTKEMDEEIIEKNNEVVKKGDTVIHAGDFTLLNKTDEVYKRYINRLNGQHIFLFGSHDHWLKKKDRRYVLERKVKKTHIVVCHYAMYTWPRSHYGSLHVFGHSHGSLTLSGRRMDIGVDTNNFYPYSEDEIIEKLTAKENYDPRILDKNR